MVNFTPESLKHETSTPAKVAWIIVVAYVLGGFLDILIPNPGEHSAWLWFMLPGVFYPLWLFGYDVFRIIRTVIKENIILVPSPITFYSFVVITATHDVWSIYHGTFDDSVTWRVIWYLLYSLMFYVWYRKLIGLEEDPEFLVAKQEIIDTSYTNKSARIKWTTKYHELLQNRKKTLDIL